MAEQLAARQFRRKGCAIDDKKLELRSSLVENMKDLGDLLFACPSFADDQEVARRTGRDFHQFLHQRPPDRAMSDEYFANGGVVGEVSDFIPPTNARGNLLSNCAVICPVKNICNARVK